MEFILIDFAKNKKQINKLTKLNYLLHFFLSFRTSHSVTLIDIIFVVPPEKLLLLPFEPE
jgi:hypothetical protein